MNNDTYAIIIENLPNFMTFENETLKIDYDLITENNEYVIEITLIDSQ